MGIISVLVGILVKILSKPFIKSLIAKMSRLCWVTS